MLIKTVTMLELWCMLIKTITMLELWCMLIQTVTMLELWCMLLIKNRFFSTVATYQRFENKHTSQI
jgi:hypothetical protein